MKVWNDRIELWNDGGLPFDMTIESLMSEHSSKPRNPNIAAVFYKAGFIESWGRGITKIRNGFLSAGLPEPLFEESCGGVRVTMYRPQIPGVGKNTAADGVKEAVMEAGGEMVSKKKTSEETNEETNGETSGETSEETDFEEKTGREISAEQLVEGRKGKSKKDNLLDEIRRDSFITQEQLAEKLGLSYGGVRYIMKQLQEEGKLEHVGSTKKGRWMIKK